VSKNHNLLVVDDEHGVADLIAEVGESLGFAVSVAHDGGAFQELYRRTDPSIIFLDLKLPGYDGVELLRFLGEEQSDATIFIASGLDQRTLAAAHAVGKQHNLDMGRALGKPLLVDDIEAALRTHVKAGMRVRPEDVRRALANDEICVHFQPKVDLLETAGTRMTGVEALARWAAPDGGWIFPDQFIPVAREAGLMRDLTDVVADRSFAAVSGWRRKGLDLAVSINLDTTTLNDRLLPDHLARLADKYGVPASRVTLEITESAAMAAPEVTMDILTRFRLRTSTCRSTISAPATPRWCSSTGCPSTS
jgi:CheY-like chemotaxis protein